MSAARGTSARLTRLVVAVALTGMLAQLVVAAGLRGSGPIAPLRGTLATLSPWHLALGLLAVTFASDWVSVRVRHGEEDEELTLFEVAVVISTLVLPALQALVLPVAATALCSLARRRGPVKTAFNAGNLAVAVAVLVATVHLVAAPGAGLTVRTVAGLTLGMLAFTTVNLVAVSRVLALAAEEDPWRVVRDGLRLSAVLALGTVALGSTAVTLAWASPALLPFVFMPAAALMFAFRAAAQEAEERERSARLLQLSALLAGRPDEDALLAGFLRLSRLAFGVEQAAVVLDAGAQAGGHSAVTVRGGHGRHGGLDSERGIGSRGAVPTRRPADPVERALLHRAAVEGARLLDSDLPDGCVRALAAPLEAEGRRLGVVLLATADPRRTLSSRELLLLTPVASALAVALRSAAHLRRLQEETSKLQAVVDSSSDGILVLDGSGVVQLWSPALQALTGRSSAAAVGRRLPDLVAALGPDGTPCDPFLAGRSPLTPAAPQTLVELTLQRDDGEPRVVRCAHAGVFDGDTLVRDVVIVHDVTRERQVERLKADFIATVSHELRTPVTPIKGYADLLRRKGDRMTPDKRAECLDVIVDRAEHLARLVEDLLLASRISATEGNSPAQVQMVREDLAQLTRRACGDFGADGARLVLDLPDTALPVLCDRMRVVQVLTNLIGNALKYSPPGSPVDVRLRSGDGEVRVEVHDRGRGIPTDQIEKVFEKFHRVEDPMRMTTGGTGLGLYIARQLASAMGGTLSCRSTLNVGSVFIFAVPGPLEAPDPPAPAPLATGRRTPPWSVPPPRPAAASEQDSAEPLR